MAFDLNKNDGSTTEPSIKKPATSKFDLSKGEVAGKTVTENPTKSKTWLIGLLGILIIGGGIWYYSSRTKAANTANSALTKVDPADSSALATTAKNETIKANIKVADTTVSRVAIPQIAKETAVNPVETIEPATLASADKSLTKGNLNHKIPATFGQGSITLQHIQQPLIKRIKSYLAQNPAAYIHVNGYASSDGSLEINQTISQARADVFKKYLVSRNVTGDRVIAVGKGIENPIASNDNQAGRNRNRRVEITLP